MPSNLDRLREGQAIEFEPGLSGRLNREKRQLELSTGQVLDASDDEHLFPRDESALKVSRHTESLEKGIKGPASEFWHQYSTQGIPGSIRDIIMYHGKDYAEKKRAQEAVSSRISDESPYLSGAATAANIGTDVVLTRGMSALKAAPALTIASAGSRLATDPVGVGADALMSAGAGWGFDKTMGGINKITARRAAAQAIPGQQQAVRNANIQGQQATNQANAAQQQQFAQQQLNVTNTNNARMQQYQQAKVNHQNTVLQQKNTHAQAQATAAQQHNILTQNVKNANQARLQQHQADLTARQNAIIQAKNAHAQAESARQAEVVRLKNQAETARLQRSAESSKLEAEYKAAKAATEQENKRMLEKFKLEQEQYEKSLKELPELQKRAQAEHSQNIIKTAQELERNFPKSSKLSTEELGVAQFLDESVQKTGLAGSREASQATRILNSIFPEGELIGGRELSSRYKALEEAIQRANPEVQQVLSSFKEHLGKRLPVIIEDAVAYSKVAPLLKRTIESDVKAILKDIHFDGSGAKAAHEKISSFALSNAKSALKTDLSQAQFMQKLQSGEMGRELANKILTVEDFMPTSSRSAIRQLEKDGLFEYVYNDAKKKHAYFVDELAKKLESRLARYELSASQSAKAAKQNLGQNLRKTYGMAEPVPAPLAPQSPTPLAGPQAPGELPPLAPLQLPQPVAAPALPGMPASPNLASMPAAPIVPPPNAPPLPNRPNLMPKPTPPTPQSFSPQIEPTLAPAQGFAEHAGDFLEQNLLGGTGLLNNPVAKLAGLKYMLGKGALPLEAGYLGMKGLTSPGAGGQMARATFKQAGIQAIENWMQQYPSYHDGILEAPQERRALTKEIEDDPAIPLEQKALLQSKVNRGRPLTAAL